MLNNLFLCQYGASRCSARAHVNPPPAEEPALPEMEPGTWFKWDYLGVYEKIKVALEVKKKHTT